MDTATNRKVAFLWIDGRPHQETIDHQDMQSHYAGSLKGQSWMQSLRKLVAQGMRDDNNSYFVVLDKGCRPLRPFADLHALVSELDPMLPCALAVTVYESEQIQQQNRDQQQNQQNRDQQQNQQNRDQHQQQQKHHHPCTIMTREMAHQMLAIDNDNTQAVVKGHPTTYLYTVPLSSVISVPLVYETVDRTAVRKITAQMKDLYRRMERDRNQGFKKQLQQLIVQKVLANVEPVAVRSVPPVSETEARQSGAYFWRGFTAAANMVPVLKPLTLSQTQKLLLFLHVTKNAGTTIEELGHKHYLYWGKYDYRLKQLGQALSNTEFWHFPLCAYSAPSVRMLLRENVPFMVLRHPTDRILSELYCPWGGPARYGGASAVVAVLQQKTLTEADVHIVNQWIAGQLHRVRQTVQTKRYKDMPHWLPQYLYLNDQQGEPVVAPENIILFSHLQSEFNALMVRHGQTTAVQTQNDMVQMQSTDHQNKGTTAKTFTAALLSDENRQLIQDLYGPDLELYNRLTAERYSAKPKPSTTPKPKTTAAIVINGKSSSKSKHKRTSSSFSVSATKKHVRFRLLTSYHGKSRSISRQSRSSNSKPSKYTYKSPSPPTQIGKNQLVQWRKKTRKIKAKIPTPIPTLTNGPKPQSADKCVTITTEVVRCPNGCVKNKATRLCTAKRG
jgi:hypothetical protein